jgi:hypothetical protein
MIQKATELDAERQQIIFAAGPLHFTNSLMMANSRLRLAAQLALTLFGGISPGCSSSHFHDGCVDHLRKDHRPRRSTRRRA